MPHSVRTVILLLGVLTMLSAILFEIIFSLPYFALQEAIRDF
jgi:hypothetical protein